MEQKLSLLQIPMFCINLDRRPDRWRNFTNQPGVKRLGNQIKRWSAVDGKNIDWKNDPNVSLVCKRNILEKSRRAHEELESVGGVGCAYSHISIWKWLAQSSHDACLIFEDDLILPSDFPEKAQFTFNNSPTIQAMDFDILTFASGSTVTEFKDRILGERFIKGVTAFFCFNCYIITKKCAQRLLTQCFPICEHIDLWVSLFKFTKDLKIITTHPIWINIRQGGIVSKTDIQGRGCSTCDLNPGFEKEYILMPIWDFYLMRGVEALAGLGVCSSIYFMLKQ
jgi:GR25 family glycosyltransferase involved in LPS biosynthesis